MELSTRLLGLHLRIILFAARSIALIVSRFLWIVVEKFISALSLAVPCFMHHSAWRNALFLHWEVDVVELQKLLPNELEADLLNGKAYIGIVVLSEEGIQPSAAHGYWPSLFQVTHLACNLRTYVRPRGRSKKGGGVYFFSLDASSAFASFGARALFGLPYFIASMSRSLRTDPRTAQSRFCFSSKRWGQHEALKTIFSVFPNNPKQESLQQRKRGSSLDDVATSRFFLERYCLYHRLPGKTGMSCGSIRHAPWRTSPVTLEFLENTKTLFQGKFASLYRSDARPDFVHFGSVESGIDFHLFTAA